MESIIKFPDCIKDIILSFFDYSDICKYNLKLYLTENSWKNLTVLHYGTKMYDINCHGSFNSWEKYFEYRMYMETATASIKYFDFTEEMSEMFILPKNNRLKLSKLIHTKFGRKFIKMAKYMYKCISKMKRGDCINKKYFIDEIYNNKYIIYPPKYGMYTYNQPINFKPIIEFPINYWNKLITTYEHYCPNFNIFTIVLKLLQFNLEEIDIENIKKVIPNLKQVVVLIHENISYGLISLSQYVDMMKDDFVLSFETTNAIDYPDFSYIIKTLSISHNISPNNFLILNYEDIFDDRDIGNWQML